MWVVSYPPQDVCAPRGSGKWVTSVQVRSSVAAQHFSVPKTKQLQESGRHQVKRTDLHNEGWAPKRHITTAARFVSLTAGKPQIVDLFISWIFFKTQRLRHEASSTSPARPGDCRWKTDFLSYFPTAVERATDEAWLVRAPDSTGSSAPSDAPWPWEWTAVRNNSW